MTRPNPALAQTPPRRRWRAPLCVALLLSVTGITAQACDTLTPTRQTGPGPHDYSFVSDSDRLWTAQDAGQPLYLRARIVNTCGRPLQGAEIQIVHADANGDHHARRWRTHLRSDARGEFRLVTLYPGYTGGLPRHIHFVISHPGHQRLITRLFFRNDATVGEELDDLAVVPERIRRGEREGFGIDYEFVLDED